MKPAFKLLDRVVMWYPVLPLGTEVEKELLVKKWITCQADGRFIPTALGTEVHKRDVLKP